MEINIEKLKNEIEQYNKIIDNYENLYLNLYNELSNCTFYWQDEKSISFFDSIAKEKLEIKNAINELNGLCSIYDYIIKKYNIIGNKISFDLNKKDKIISKINNFIDKTHTIYNKYNSINLSHYPSEARYLYIQMNKLKEVENDLIKLKNTINNIFISIEEIEKEVNLKIETLSVKTIKENAVKLYI